MLKQTLFFSKPSKLSLRLQQLVIERENEPVVTRPIEDLSAVILENQQISITLPLLNELARNNVATIICDEHFMPAIMLAPLEANATQQEAYKYQLNSSLPTMKRLWKEIVEAKIRNQEKMLRTVGKNSEQLKPLYANVKSGDVENREGIAARLYWQELFGKDFIRDRFGIPPNNLLNYGYTILRAATARALMGAGLHPAFGLFHHNKYDPFPLADDMMEPYRPFVDSIVYKLYADGQTELNNATKSALIQVLYCDTWLNKQTHPLQVALTISSASLLKVMKSDVAHLSLPDFLP